MMWYLGLGLLMLGTGFMGATKRKGLWYLERILIILPLIIVLEPLANTFFFRTDWLPMTLHGSILINGYEVALACAGFLLGKALIQWVKRRRMLNP